MHSSSSLNRQLKSSSSSLMIKIVLILILIVFLLIDSNRKSSTHYLSGVEAYRVKSTTDPSFECSGCARTRLIGCFHGQCSYRCYRSCTNGTNVVIEAHRFILEGQRRRRKRYLE